MSLAVRVGKQWEARLDCFPPVPKLGDSLMRPEATVVRTVREQLLNSPHADVRRVECEYCGGLIVLTGRVSNFFQKQVALAIVGRHVPIECVRDEIFVG